MSDARRPVAVVLAGGLARRMGGGDKGLLRLARRPLLDHVLDRIRPQVRAVALSANGDPARFVAWGLPVLRDPVLRDPVLRDPGRGEPVSVPLGPLGGVLAGMRWARQVHPRATLLLSVPTDTPFLPPDLVARLHAARDAAGLPVAGAATAGQRHPVIALWPVALADALAAALAEGVRGVGSWAESRGLAVADFGDAAGAFLNVNEPADLARAAREAG
ncbi:MAG: molybdenum cofactor guanylyltransferase [Alphaproteobacteria bacterium]|nr:molybdenum cofactor guanylyltransferase [Alphaproteobacteria bacterium]